MSIADIRYKNKIVGERPSKKHKNSMYRVQGTTVYEGYTIGVTQLYIGKTGVEVIRMSEARGVAPSLVERLYHTDLKSGFVTETESI